MSQWVGHDVAKLVDGFEFLDKKAMKFAGIKESVVKIKNKDFVKDSPKLKFTADSVVKFSKNNPTIKKRHPTTPKGIFSKKVSYMYPSIG